MYKSRQPATWVSSRTTRASIGIGWDRISSQNASLRLMMFRSGLGFHQILVRGPAAPDAKMIEEVETVAVPNAVLAD